MVDNKYRREITQLMHVIIPTVVLNVVCLGYDGHFLAETSIGTTGFNREGCSLETLRHWSMGWVTCDTVSLFLSLAAVVIMFFCEPTANGSKKKRVFIQIVFICLFICALAEIAADIMRILMFSKNPGQEGDRDGVSDGWIGDHNECLYGDLIDNLDAVHAEPAKEIVRLQWWFYPFTTFVCGFVNFVLHCVGCGMSARIQQRLKSLP